MKVDISIDRLRSLFDYDPATGIITWKVAQRNSIPAGSVAGGVHYRNKYITIGVDKKKYGAHRIAWAISHGEWPPGFIDHINGSRADNRLANLRVVNPQENMQNITHVPNNTSGFRGVSFWQGKWVACISVKNKKIYLGRFDDPELASEAYLKARSIHYSVQPHPTVRDAVKGAQP